MAVVWLVVDGWMDDGSCGVAWYLLLMAMCSGGCLDSVLMTGLLVGWLLLNVMLYTHTHTHD